jgi:AcrR family transcriptional regulator
MSAERQDAPAGARAGRPRDPGIDTAVLASTLRLLDGGGYARLTLDAAAREAGTSKPAIYRRWGSRQRLVLAALSSRLGEVHVPDTGCTLCDLDECLKVFVAAFDRIAPDVLGPLLADCADDEALRAEFMRALFDPPRAAVREALDRAHGRGDLRADVDRELVLDLIGSFVHYRAVFAHAPMSHGEIERAVQTLLQGIATDFPALLAHSRRLAGDPDLHHLHA